MELVGLQWLAEIAVQEDWKGQKLAAVGMFMEGLYRRRRKKLEMCRGHFRSGGFQPPRLSNSLSTNTYGVRRLEAHWR